VRGGTSMPLKYQSEAELLALVMRLHNKVAVVDCDDEIWAGFTSSLELVDVSTREEEVDGEAYSVAVRYEEVCDIESNVHCIWDQANGRVRDVPPYSTFQWVEIPGFHDANNQ
jgi:hypothetical protein